ncbi:MAG: FAD-dependent oxidoreductase [Gemmatimonadaceae bacterium]
MDRRTFLQSTGAPLGAAALSSIVPSLVQAASAGHAATLPRAAVTDVVVIGGGAFGVWTALALREMGHQVTLLDAYGPGSSRATSGDETRQIRVGYGDREGYARMAHRAMDAWTAREAEFGVPLLVRTGRLEIAPTWTPALRATQAMLARFGVATEAFTVDELRRRYPQMGFDGIGVGLLEPGAGVVRAKQAILTAAATFARKGGTVVVQRAEPGRAEGGRLVDVTLADGSRLAAQQFVFACGPWLPKVFPDLLGRRIRVPKRDVLYFGVPAGDTRFAPPALPNFSESAYYGFPSIDGRGVKVCPTNGPDTWDPDTDERIVDPMQVRRARLYLTKRFPALAAQPITETRVCQLENTEDEHFLIDRHPAYANVLIAGGGSGHAFKHGPVLGEYVARRTVGEPTDPTFDAMVRLAR